MNPLELLGIAVLVFTAIKTIFAVLQWVLEDKGDPILRGSLDRIHDIVDKLTLRQLSARILFRTVAAVSNRVLRPGKPKWKLVALLFALNTLAYVIGQGMYCHMRNECGSTLGHDSVLAEDGVAKLIVWFLLSFTASTAVQLVCIKLVWRLMKLTAERFTVSRLLLCLAVSVGALPTVLVAQYSIQQLARFIAFGLPPRLENFWLSFTNMTPYFWATCVMAVVAGLPIVAYLIVLAISVTVRSSPNFIRLAFIWVVFKVTTDNTPVLERIGSVAGGIASLSSALAGYLKA